MGGNGDEPGEVDGSVEEESAGDPVSSAKCSAAAEEVAEVDAAAKEVDSGGPPAGAGDGAGAAAGGVRRGRSGSMSSRGTTAAGVEDRGDSGTC